MWQNWQIRQYLVNRVYPEELGADSPAVKRASIILNGASMRAIEDSDRESDSDDSSADGRKDVEEFNGMAKDNPYVSR